MKQGWIAALVLCAAGTPVAQAEVAFALGPWHYDLAGTVTQQGSTLDFRDDLGLESDTRRTYRLEWNAARGWWPELALDHASVVTRGRQLQTDGVQFGPVPVQDGDTLLTSGRLDDTALLARYPFQWGPLALRAGVAVRRLSGDIVITNADTADEDRQPFDPVFPELHGALRLRLGRVLTLVASAQGASYQDNSATQWRVGAELNIFRPMIVEFSMMQKQLDLRAGTYALDATVEGNRLQVGVRIPR